MIIVLTGVVALLLGTIFGGFIGWGLHQMYSKKVVEVYNAGVDGNNSISGVFSNKL